jgi:hypothetical protein
MAFKRFSLKIDDPADARGSSIISTLASLTVRESDKTAVIRWEKNGLSERESSSPSPRVYDVNDEEVAQRFHEMETGQIEDISFAEMKAFLNFRTVE